MYNDHTARSPVLMPELINPAHLRHIIISPRSRAQRTAELLFGENKPAKCNFRTEPDVGEWDYGKYEGMLTKDIRKEKPDWSIWDDGCPPGETPGESPQQMSDRVDRVIARIRALHRKAEEEAGGSAENADYADVIIFSHGHFSRCFIARWCDLPLKAGYHFAADAGGVSLRQLFTGHADDSSLFSDTSTVPSRSLVSAS